MILLAAAAVLIVVVVLVGLALGFTSSRPGTGLSILAIGGGGLLVLVAGAVVLAGVGLGGGGEEEDAAPAEVDTTTTTTTRTTRSTAVTTTVPSRDGLDAPEIAMHANPGDDFAGAPSTIDRLSSPAVLRVTATGFQSGAAGLIEQCTAQGCGNAFPVTFGDAGIARLQYLVAAEVATGPGEVASCRPHDPPCVVRVSSRGTAAFATTVFGGSAPPPPAVSIETPPGGVVDGAAVTVAASGFTPGERVQAMLCAAPASRGTARCGAPGAVAPFTIDADGTGRTAIVIRRGRVGTEGVACGRETKCGITVSRAGSSVPGPVVVVSFAAGPSATYESARLAFGLLLAGALLLFAWALVRTTDWRKPTEADTPELDRAVFVD